MSDPQNLFDDAPQVPVTPTETPVTPPAPVADPFEAMLANIKAEDGRVKYNSVPDALKALEHSQAYIAQLQAQIKELETKASQNVTMEQVMELVNKQKTPADEPKSTPGLTAEDVMRILQQQESQKKAEANTQLFIQKFKTLYGEKSKEVFYGKASEMGLNPTQIESLVASSPQAVFTMFGITDKPAPASLPSGINTAAMVDPAPTPIKTAMGFVSENDLLDNWRQCAKAVHEQLGIRG